MTTQEPAIFHHTPGTPIVVPNAVAISVEKETLIGENGEPLYRCGFRIGGGIDQDPRKSPHGYRDHGIYVTGIHEGTPAHRSGLQVHDKLLQVNGHNFTMVTHKQACDWISKYPVLNILIARKDN
ncbi:tax1-binding protein 3 homolog [Paramacrobiotus metropolitanus]|uniref:tax1-binding protein 3 homolog n=1 Tax=Paramacrobiotus metropolitanus TaxID=2943436 RepID=UPI002445A0FD|nr:tax1-binding protein 3 homolog [Paramacrobiotus metropolitanus]